MELDGMNMYAVEVELEMFRTKQSYQSFAKLSRVQWAGFSRPADLFRKNLATTALHLQSTKSCTNKHTSS